MIVELREWSRIADDLQQERNRLANRVREQPWRYYPQMLKLPHDFADQWFLDLWSKAPTPAKAARLRETTIERILKAHRIRRWQAAEVARILKQQPLSVAPGVTEAASAHIRAVTARLRLVNQQLKDAHRRLDQLCDQLVPPGETQPGQHCEQRDVVILRSMPGLGRINLAALLAEAWQPLRRRDYHALRCLSGVAPVTRRSGKSCSVTPATGDCRQLSIIGPAWPPSTTRPAVTATPSCAGAVTATAAPCALSPTACCRSPALCLSIRPCSIPPTRLARPPPRKKVVCVEFRHLTVVSGGVAGEAPTIVTVTFDNWLRRLVKYGSRGWFLCSIAAPFLRPDLASEWRRAQPRSRLARPTEGPPPKAARP